MLINSIRAQYSKLIAFLLVRFAPTSEQIEARNRRALERTIRQSYEAGTKLDRRVAALEDLIEKLDAEADRLSVLADEENLLTFRATLLLKTV